jgi:hypothetical protein
VADVYLERPAQNGNDPLREIVEASQPAKAEKAGNQKHDIWSHRRVTRVVDSFIGWRLVVIQSTGPPA